MAMIDLDIQANLQSTNVEDRRKVHLITDVNIDNLMNLGLYGNERRFANLNRQKREPKIVKNIKRFHSPFLVEKERLRLKIKERILFLKRNGWNLKRIKQEISDASEFAWSVDSEIERAGEEGEDDSSEVDDFEDVYISVHQSLVNPFQGMADINNIYDHTLSS